LGNFSLSFEPTSFGWLWYKASAFFLATIEIVDIANPLVFYQVSSNPELIKAKIQVF